MNSRGNLKGISLLVPLMLAVTASGAGCGDCSSPFSSSRPRRNAPDFTLPAFSGTEDITLSRWTDKGPVLLVFWASWCPPCVQEIPVLNEWHQKYGPRGLGIIGVNIQESREHLADFFDKYGVSYPVALDLDGEVASRYGIAGLPVAIMLAKGGEIIYYGFTLPRIENYLH